MCTRAYFGSVVAFLRFWRRKLTAYLLIIILTTRDALTFESLDEVDVGCSYLYICYISRQYGSASGSYMGSSGPGQGQGHMSKKVENSYSAQCKTAIGHNSGSITDRAMKFVCSIGFSAMADGMV